MDKYRIIVFVLMVLHAVGILGIWTNYWPPFILLTPINLLISLGLILWNHQPINSKLWTFVLLVFIIGWSAEWFGVNTGLLFGNYAYGKTLGPQIGDTPLMIGINWVMITYIAGMLVNQIIPQSKVALKVITASFLMVGLDFLIEPIAPSLDFWSWQNNHIPTQNYVGWLLVALIVQSLFFKLFEATQNKAGSALFFIQLGFFLTLNLII